MWQRSRRLCAAGSPRHRRPRGSWRSSAAGEIVEPNSAAIRRRIATATAHSSTHCRWVYRRRPNSTAGRSSRTVSPSTSDTTRTAALPRTAANHARRSGHARSGRSLTSPDSPAAATDSSASTSAAIVSRSMHACPCCGAHTARAMASKTSAAAGSAVTNSATTAAVCTSAAPSTPASIHGWRPATSGGARTLIAFPGHAGPG